jgi:hypothetical protein
MNRVARMAAGGTLSDGYSPPQRANLTCLAYEARYCV